MSIPVKPVHRMGLFGAVSLGISAMVGAGIFALLGHAAVAARADAPLAFVIGGVVAALSGYSYARLSATYPSGGGIHEFYRLAFGNSVITGWLSLLFLLTLITTTAMIARTFGVYAHRIIPLAPGNVWIPAYAAAIVILLMWVNLAGSRLVGRLAIVLVGIKMTVLAILLVYGLIQAEVSRIESLGFSSPTTLLGTVGLTFLAYSGYGQITNAADAVERPERTIPLALLLAVSIVAVFYVGLAWVALGTVPIAELKLHADTAMAQVAHPLFGPAGVVILALTAMVSTSSAINAQLFSQLQMGARMARCGQLPASLQEGERPYNRMLVGGIVVATIIMAAFFNLGAIAQAASATYLITYVAVQIAHWRLRRQTNGSLWLIIAGLLLMLVVLAAFGLEIWQTTPSVFITIAVMLAGGWLVAWLIRPRTAAPSGPG